MVNLDIQSVTVLQPRGTSSVANWQFLPTASLDENLSRCPSGTRGLRWQPRGCRRHRAWLPPSPAGPAAHHHHPPTKQQTLRKIHTPPCSQMISVMREKNGQEGQSSRAFIDVTRAHPSAACLGRWEKTLDHLPSQSLVFFVERRLL